MVSPSVGSPRAVCEHSLSTGHKQDGQAADDRQDHGDDDQDGLGQLSAAPIIAFGTQRVDLAALAVVIPPTSVSRGNGSE